MDADPWMMFRPAADAFNSNRSALIKSGLTINLDESMCPHRPRFTKTGLRYHGAPLMPNISFVKRKPRPFGKELKVAAGTTVAFQNIEIEVGSLAAQVALRRWIAP